MNSSSQMPPSSCRLSLLQSLTRRASVTHLCSLPLTHCTMPKAMGWLISVYDQLTSLDELLQMSIIEVIRLDCKNDTTH
ncbi:hypothetical protein BDR06DRAFT_1072604 [Suillus hirtellus]|nr:hypothetical protein BDR06DRAFT_1072604 [Suillus hirtellus]